MSNKTFQITAPLFGEYDVVVCGGGIAGFASAVSAAREGMKVALIEKGGYLGGIMTQGIVPHFIDAANKGGIVKEMLDYLNSRQWTCPRKGERVDENGKKIPGFLIDIEGAKYYFDEVCTSLGIELFYYSRLCAVNTADGKIESLLISSDGGNFSVKGKIYIDATGNGNLADMCGCRYDCGEPDTGIMQSMSMEYVVAGYPADNNGVESEKQKTEYHQLLEKHNITMSGGQAGFVKLPALKTWVGGGNYEYNIRPDDIKGITNATIHGRKEVIDTVKKHAEIPGYEGLETIHTSDHIGVREGRRVLGQYRITLDDIIEGKRFPDGICLVKFIVDVHKLKKDDTLDNKRGIKTKPYNIPYRSLVPLDVDNMLLAGRCISGDFYPHASYRVMGNMAATGEAAGYAASICVKDNILPCEVDGTKIRSFMDKKGYEL